MNVSTLASLLLFVKNYLSLINAQRRILIQSVTFTSRYRQRGPVVCPDSANAYMSTYCTAISLIKQYCAFERARIPNSPREIKRFAISNEQTTFLR